ncbi:MAG: membrane dipeptidase [Clostridia bacterium]|nr:membrane dipeptidase [Clostridia bacterium]
MKLSLFDLHCDTAHRMLDEHQPLQSNDLCVSLERASAYEQYVQVMALWTPPAYSDADGWHYACRMLENLRCDQAIRTEQAVILPNPNLKHTPKVSLYLSVEDARILDGQLARVDQLYQMGVRILTPLWAGFTCIGGAHDTDASLTEFGKLAASRAAELGMILDVSHASEASAEELIAIAQSHGRPAIASHSNAYAISPVSRNLRDEQILAIIRTGGLIGINLHAPFLNCERDATVEDVLRHVEYISALGGEETLALGCDMDGCKMPAQIPDLAHLMCLAETLARHNYSEAFIRGIFYDHSNRFRNTYLCQTH